MTYVFIVVLIVVIFFIQKQSTKDPLAFVRYHTYTSKLIVEPDEDFDVFSVIENTRRRPLLFIEMQESLPVKIQLEADDLYMHYVHSDPGKPSYSSLHLYSTIYLMPRQQLKRRISASLPARGRYSLLGAFIRCGDFFGLNETFRQFNCLSEIVVLPAPAKDTPALCALGGFLGSVSVRRFIMKDPVLTVGFRDYTGREPQKTISWTQSARFNQLMVKEYDHTLEPSITILLNVECIEVNNSNQTHMDDDTGIQNAALLERCFSLTRTVCEQLEKQRIQYGFVTNATTSGIAGHWSFISDGLGKSHLSTILEGLGRATYDCTEPFNQTVERAIHLAENGRSHVIITPYEHPALRYGVDRLRVLTGGEAAVISARP